MTRLQQSWIFSACLLAILLLLTGCGSAPINPLALGKWTYTLEGSKETLTTKPDGTYSVTGTYKENGTYKTTGNKVEFYRDIRNTQDNSFGSGAFAGEDFTFDKDGKTLTSGAGPDGSKLTMTKEP